MQGFKTFQYAVFIGIVVLYSACSEDEPAPIDPSQDPANAELFKFLDDFESEASARGVDLPLDNFQLTFVDSIAGFCSNGWWDYNGTGIHRVEISNQCWPNYTESQKENLIFHEFGHALLSRTHIDTRFDGSYPNSLMCGDCDQTTIYYHPEMREFYLDELFNPNLTPDPDWAKLTELARPVFQDDFELGNSWIDVPLDDENRISGWDSETYEEDENTSLRVISDGIPLPGSSFLVLKRFEVAEFQDCSSLKATAKLRFKHTMNGTVTMGLSLRERLLTGNLQRFMYHGNDETVTSSEVEREFTMSIHCMPEKTDIVTISFVFASETPVDLTIDDVVVELWN